VRKQKQFKQKIFYLYSITLSILLIITSVLIYSTILNEYRENIATYYSWAITSENRAHILSGIDRYPWREEVQNSPRHHLVTPIHYDSFSDRDIPVFSLVRAYNERDYWFFIELQKEYRRLMYIYDIDPSIGEVAIFTDRGELFIPFEINSDKEEIVNYIQENILPLYYNSSVSNKNGYHVFAERSAESGFLTVLYADMSEMNRFARELQFLVFAITTLIGIVTLFILHRVLSVLTKPLKELNSSLQNVSFSNLNLSLSNSNSLDDIHYINQSFDKVFTELNRSISETIEARANEERANYLALESQMNPHTMFNTIAMIESSCYRNGDKETADLCCRFAQMMRYISNFSTNENTLLNEVENLRNYAVLTEKRYENRLLISIHLDETLESTYIPKFTLLPLVENAIKHAFCDSTVFLNVDVVIARQEMGWFISIKDNGVGFDPLQKQKVYDRFAACDRRLAKQVHVLDKKIGELSLENIYMRHKIYYKDRFRLRIEDCHPGSRVILEINEEGMDENIHS